MLQVTYYRWYLEDFNLRHLLKWCGTYKDLFSALSVHQSAFSVHTQVNATRLRATRLLTSSSLVLKAFDMCDYTQREYSCGHLR